MKRPRIPIFLTLAVLVYVGFRALVLHTNFEAVCLPIYEMAMGNIAKCAIEGVHSIPLHQYYDNCGGHLVTGLLATPFYAVVGDSYLALKLVPVTLGLLTLILIWTLLDRFVGRRAADLSAFLFALGPPTLSKYSMLAKGNHFENLFFQVSVYFCFLWFHKSGRRALPGILLGLAGGFSIFFYFGSMVIVLLVAVTHLVVRGVRGSLADLRFVLPGFLLGVTPLVAVNVQSHRPLHFLSHKLGTTHRATPDEALERVGRFFTDLLPRSACYEDLGPIPGRVGETLFLAAFAAAWIVLLVPIARGLARAFRGRFEAGWDSVDAERGRFEELRLAPLVAYFPLVVLAIGVGNFDFKPYARPVEVGQFRYLVPHFMYATMLVGAAVAALGTAPRRTGRVLGVVLAVTALSTTLFTLPIVDLGTKDTGHGPRYQGFMYRGFAHVLLRDSQIDQTTGRHRWDDAHLRRQVEAFDDPERHWIYEGIGKLKAMAWLQDRTDAAGRVHPGELDLDAITAPFPDDVRIDLAIGAGTLLRLQPASRLERVMAELASSGNDLSPWVVTGLGTEAGYPVGGFMQLETHRTESLARFVPPLHLGSWQRGRGMTAGALLQRGFDEDVQIFRGVLGRTAPAGLRDFWFGVGWGLVERWEEGGLPAAVERLADPGLRGALFQGLGAGWRHYHGSAGLQVLYDELREVLALHDLAPLESGLRWPNHPAPYRL